LAQKQTKIPVLSIFAYRLYFKMCH
jgi:hypothetical protein